MAQDETEVAPLTDAESAQLDVTLALVNDNPAQAVTLPARVLCYVLARAKTESWNAALEAAAEAIKAREETFDVAEVYRRCPSCEKDALGTRTTCGSCNWYDDMERGPESYAVTIQSLKEDPDGN